MVSTVVSPVIPEVQASGSSFSALGIKGAVVIRPRNAEFTPPYADPLTVRNKLIAARLNICDLH